MAERETHSKVPRAKVESAPEGTPARDHREPIVEQVSEAPEAGATAPQEPKVSTARARESMRAWLHETFPGHEHAFVWGIIGFFVALLFFAIGFWRTLLVIVLVVAGVAFGQVLDGDPRIINTLRSLFSGDNGR